jgi:hypothetical protein
LTQSIEENKEAILSFHFSFQIPILELIETNFFFFLGLFQVALIAYFPIPERDLLPEESLLLVHHIK